MYTVTVTVGPIADYLVWTETVLFDFSNRENKIHCLLQIINQSCTKRRMLSVHNDDMFPRKTYSAIAKVFAIFQFPLYFLLNFFISIFWTLVPLIHVSFFTDYLYIYINMLTLSLTALGIKPTYPHIIYHRCRFFTFLSIF